MIHQSLKITGNVQGVGFRPFIYKLASSLNLKGYVANDASTVRIEIFGPYAALEQFRQKLLQEYPIHARIDSITLKESNIEQPTTPKHFEIKASLNTTYLSVTKNIPSDQRICHACLKELFDPQDRRHHYPFINCTDCGPRYSLIKALPYDRHTTSMATFEMCSTCKTEYQSPSQRRFHAQPNACKECGPSLSLHQSDGKIAPCEDQIIETARQLQAGKIVALKGIGGFHLMCDARNPEAVKTLRSRKHRPDKPFAIMVLNTCSLNTFAKLSDSSEKLLQSSPAPIVLLPKQAHCDDQLKHIALNVSDIGCMLPYTPIHYLLFQALSKGTLHNNWLDDINETVDDTVLVVTSANLSGEPIISDNESCLKKLVNIADYFLLHDRDIIAPSDDSVLNSPSSICPSSTIRRARGFAPQAIKLPESSPSILACGAFLKNTFCLTQGNQAYLSPHIGELESIESCLHFRESIERHIQLLGITPKAVVCDLHPDFYSSRFAEEYSRTHNIPLIKVQHHRAHIAAVLAEHLFEKDDAIIGLALDGVGLGDDNTAWGGELFYGPASSLQRIAHLSPLALPGGDIATKEIWRLGAALLSKLPDTHYYQEFAKHITKLSKLALNNPAMENFITQTQHSTSSSAGRWFDAIASILHTRSQVSFEGQAAMQVEQLAGLYCEQFGELPKTKHMAKLKEDGMLDLYPIVPAILDTPIQTAAAQFHSEVIDGLLRWINWAAKDNTTRTVVCSGGCFQNKILRDELKHRLCLAGFKTYFPEKAPANDGGVSLGQAWIASVLLKQEH